MLVAGMGRNGENDDTNPGFTGATGRAAPSHPMPSHPTPSHPTPDANARDRPEPRVVVRDLTKIYRTRRGDHVALDRVSIEIGAGEFVVLLGPSGCGKTTLLRCIAGLEEPDAGEIVINGKVVYSAERRIFLPPEKRQLNMVFQSYALWPHLSVLENVAYPLRNIGTQGAKAVEAARAALDLVGLDQFVAAYPGQLSGGQQQRVALARAIVSNDGLVLFDEPLSNLDAKVRDRLRIELLGLQERIGFSAVYVTHDQMEALALADRIAVMGIGRIEQVGTPREIYDLPSTRYVADFVGQANEIAGRVASVGSGTVQVETAIGTLTCQAPDPALATGAAVGVLFRPEHCALGRTDAADADNLLSGVVERSLYLGPIVQYVIRCHDETLIVSASGGALIESGTGVSVRLPVARTRVFPREAR
ncbi:MAG: ABC transporter ATP-binding protein [Azospirillaceae bacterium]